MNKLTLAVCGALLIFLSPAESSAVEPSPAVCDAYAKDMANQSVRGRPGLGRGAARGAALGAILGDSRKSARKGAILGALAGGARKARARSESYDRHYADCMMERVTLN